MGRRRTCWPSRSTRPTRRSSRSRSSRTPSSTTAPTVKAENFVKAWNWAAYVPNGAQNASFFADIQGFDDVYTEDPDGPDGPKKAPEPKAKDMSGLKVVDDWNFEVTLSAPTSVFPTKLGYSAFMPLPDAFFSAAPADFGKKPIGNGPVKLVSWQDDVEIKLSRFDDYSLRDKMKIKDVTVKIYQDDTAAYNDLLAGNLDFQQQVPVSALAGEKWKTDLGERAMPTTTPSTGIIAFPIYDKRFQNPKLRKAISLSVDRQSITDKIFFGNRKPADSWANPLTPGAEPGNCTACKFDVAQAKQLLAEAGGFTGRADPVLQRRRQPQGVDGGRRPADQDQPGHRRGRRRRADLRGLPQPTSTPTR